MRSIRFLAAPVATAAFVVWGATAVIAGPTPTGLVACDINDDSTKDLAFVGAASTSQANFDKATLVVAGSPAGDGLFSTGGAVWELQTCGRFGSAGLVSQGVGGNAINFVRVQVLSANGMAIDNTVFAARGGGAWDYAGIADVDGDDIQDIVFQGVDGTSGQPFAKVSIVLGANAGTDIFIQTANGLFDYVSKGDTDDDGDEDLFFESNDGNNFRIDLSDGTAPPVKNVKPSGGFSIATIGDVNGDSKADMVLNNVSSAKLQTLDGATFLSSMFRPNGGGTLVPIAAGDTDNNGADDVLYNNPSSPASTRIDLMVNGSLGLMSQGFISTGNFVPTVLGDFDADNKDDIAGQAPGGTRLTLLDGTTATTGNFVNTNGNYLVTN